MIKWTCVLFLLFFVFPGCGEKALNIKIEYDHINGLEQGDRIIFEGNHIGHVTNVFHTKGGRYLVGVSIKGNFKNAVTEHSRFSIVEDPKNIGNKAIEMSKIKPGGELLKEGETYNGSTRSSAFFEKTKEALEKSVEELRKQFEEFSDELKKLPENEDFKNFKKELDTLPDKIRKAGESARKKLEKDVLPRLKRDMEELKKKFLKPENKKEKDLIKT